MLWIWLEEEVIHGISRSRLSWEFSPCLFYGNLLSITYLSLSSLFTFINKICIRRHSIIKINLKSFTRESMTISRSGGESVDLIKTKALGLIEVNFKKKLIIIIRISWSYQDEQFNSFLFDDQRDFAIFNGTIIAKNVYFHF